ncbi:HPP family protein [Desulfoscipio sp. XC116]|uniref:HPP family protein n=1 Tax=Desulfoscipio sp. XC116 TaxID=3144975 RepID=UPI00325B2004
MKNTLEQTVPGWHNMVIKTLVTYLCKMKGGRCTSLPMFSISGLFVTALGSFAGIGLVAILSDHYHLPLLLPSFGASAVLLYAACHVPMAQPRNVVGGHLISALMGVTVYQVCGDAWWAIALGVTSAIVAMTLTRTLHPPGGATAFIAVYTAQDFGFIFSPVGLGALCLVLIALLVNNISTERKYPDYWY